MIPNWVIQTARQGLTNNPNNPIFIVRASDGTWRVGLTARMSVDDNPRLVCEATKRGTKIEPFVVWSTRKNAEARRTKARN